MSAITTRAGKGSELTFSELDANFTNLNTDKYQAGDALGTPASGTLTNCTGLPISTGVSGLATGVTTALGVNVGTAGAVVVNGGALGTPASGNFSAGSFIWPTFNQNTTGSAGSVANAVTFNNSGAGAASGTTYNGSAARTISYNTIGAQPAGTYVTSVTGTAPVVSSGGTTPAISMAAATSLVDGYLTSADWTTFNGKQAALVSGTNIKTVGGNSLLGSGDVGIIGATYGGTGVNNGTRTLAVNTNSGTLSFTNAATTLTIDNTGSISGTNTGDQTITLTGDVTGSGTGSFATTIAAASTGTGNLVRATSPTIATPTITTSATVPLVIGGTGTTSTLTLRATSGVGTTGSDIIFQVGNNGATEAMRVISTGWLGVSTNAPDAPLSVNGVASFGDGAEGAPGIANFGDLDTGIWFPAANTMAISTGGVERFQINSIGTVFIGNGSTDTAPANGLLAGTSGSGTDIVGATLTIQAGRGTGTGAGGPLVFSTANAGAISGTTLNTATEKMRISPAGNVGIGDTTPVNKLDINGSLGRNAPVTKTGNFTLGATENWIICNGTATITVTLPAASSWTGREVMIKTRAAFAVVSASSNVVPLTSGTAGTAILAATAGKWATLVSDGTNWVIMQGN